jgi:hypothetical protein
MPTLRDLIFSGIGSLGVFLTYLAKRSIEKIGLKESVDLDQRKFELIEKYLAIRNQLEPQGLHVEPPATVAALITVTNARPMATNT